MTPFRERLQNAWIRSGGMLCVGLDPDHTRVPPRFASSAQPSFELAREVIDATCDLACAYKPQIAFYSAASGESELERTIAHIRLRAPHALVLLDAKRGDMGNTATAYAREAFERYGADAVTVNAYLGEDGVKPFIADPARGAFVVCRTSNPGARDFQDLVIDGRPLYRHVAERVARDWNAHDNVGLVVGATYPEDMAALRRAHPTTPFLVPGVGAQGGDVAAAVKAGVDAQGLGLLVSSSRAIMYAGDADAIRAAAKDVYDRIDASRRVGF